MKNMKRIVSLLLVLIMALTAFTGCGKKEKEQVNNGPRKLTVGVPQDATIPDYDTNGLTLYLEKATGIEIEWVYFASGSSNYKQQLTLMCTGGEELPDVLVGFNSLGHYVVNQFGEDGFIVDLAPYLDEYAPNYKKAMAGQTKSMQQYVKEKGTNTVDGKSFFAMPSIGLECIDNMQTMAYINQTWLDKLGLKAPTTVAELEAVCQAFATKDPNGNGQADEMPMMGSFSNWIINAYVEYDSGNFNVKDGKVWDPIMTDEWRQGMTKVADLVKKGYYNELSFTLSATEKKNLISPTDGPSKVGMFTGHHESMTNASTDALDHFTALAPLKDETGKGGYNIINEVDAAWGAMVTVDCDNVPLAVEFLDAFYADEAVTSQRHGVKGVDWEYVEGTNAYGTPSYARCINSQVFFDGSLNATLGNLLYIMTQWNYLLIDEGLTEGRVAQAARLQREQWAIHEASKERESVSTLVYTTDEYETRELKAGNVSSYISEQSTLFATGDKDITDNKVWDEFKSQVKALGRDELLKIAQDAYDRKLEREK